MSSAQHKPRAIFAATLLFGHVEKLQVVAAEFIKRGYPVTFFTGSAFPKGIEAVGATFVSLQEECELG